MAAKIHLVKAMVFPVVVYGCESWTVKKAECRRIDDFEVEDMIFEIDQCNTGDVEVFPNI